jgi:chemotaxis protein methyltransferase CheR
MEMTPLAARSLAGLFERTTGQELGTGRQWRIGTALQPILRRYDIPTFDMLAATLARSSGSELRSAVVEALLNHETSFYRDLGVFQAIRAALLPRLAAARAASRRLRIWSAGCSTGQEVHSLAMMFRADDARWTGWTIEILGTDVSAQAIEQAREGRYSQMEIQRGLPITDLLARFDQEGESWRIRPDAAARPVFRVHNLLDPPPAGPFDMILCRNVLLYFAADRKRQVLDRLASVLAPDGFLILGAGETVLDQTDALGPDAEIKGMYRPVGR